MATDRKPPVILLAFANDRDRHLRNLDQEHHDVLNALKPAKSAGLCEVEHIAGARADDIFKAFVNEDYQNRIAVFHFGGHADDYHLLFESAGGRAKAAHASGLADILGQQGGLPLVFLNACSTAPQVTDLLRSKVKAVIATSQAINDEVARTFAVGFYQALGGKGGKSIGVAFKLAAANVKLHLGSDTRAFFRSDVEPPEDGRPWALYPEGEPFAAAWSLPEAADNPTYGLPDLLERDLPDKPFLEPLAQYTAKEAEVYFGRGYQIRDLYERATDPQGPPILLVYGQTGVGKSSLLEAGLLPRLDSGCEVRYLKRGEQKCLLGLLSEALLAPEDNSSLRKAWRAEEERLGRPLVVILDQVELAITRPNPSQPCEVEELAAALWEALGDQDNRPKGKLILSFRKQWLADIKRPLDESRLQKAQVEILVKPLDRRGIIEAVRGPGRLFDPKRSELERPILAERIYKQYGLEVEVGLPEVIADRLRADPGSPVAPTLQVLLCKMWEQARERNRTHPRFDLELYRDLSREGILLKDFLDQQLAKVEQLCPEVVNSGLALDLLEYHTTSLGIARERTARELHEDFGHLGEVVRPLVQKCVDLDLLTTVSRNGEGERSATRLVHDTLAPLVRDRFDSSDRPAQRARRILKNRAVDWAEGEEGVPLDEADLALVEQGESAMRAWTPDERRLVEASRRGRDRRELDRLRARARDLLGRIGHARGPISRVELEALWELACLREQDERARILFLQQALEEPGTSEQLANRLELAVHAAVGLSLERRRRVLDEVVIPVLRRPATIPQILWISARVGIALGARNEEFAGLASEALKTYVDSTGAAISNEVLVLPQPLPTAVAERIAEQLLLAWGKASNPPRSVKERILDARGSPSPSAEIDELERCLEIVTAQLPATATGRVVARVLGAMAITRDLGELKLLANYVAAVAPKLPATAPEPLPSIVADQLLNALAVTTDLDEIERLAAGLDMVVRRWLPAQDAERVAALIADSISQRVLDSMGQTDCLDELVRLAERLDAPAFRLTARAAEDVATQVRDAVAKTSDQLLDAMEKTDDCDELVRLAKRLHAVAPRLPARAAEDVAAQVRDAMAKTSDQLLDTMEKTDDSDELVRLAKGIGAMAPWLTASAAEKYAALAYDQLYSAELIHDFPSGLLELDEGILAVAPWLPAPVAKLASDWVLPSMVKTRDPDKLAMIISAVAPRIPASTLVSAADRILDAMARTDDSDKLVRLAERLDELAPQLTLTPQDAERIATRAIDRILAVMAKTKEPEVLRRLGAGLGALGVVVLWLPARAAGRAAEQIVNTFSRPLFTDELWQLVRCFERVAPGLPASAAKRSTKQIVNSLSKTRLASELIQLVRCFERVAPGLPARAPERIGERAADRILDAMARTDDSVELERLALSFAVVARYLLAPAAERAAERIHADIVIKHVKMYIDRIEPVLAAAAGNCDVRTITNLLKFPLYVGPLRNTLLQVLERRTGMTFGGDIWSLVDQAKALGLSPDDLSSPPGATVRLTARAQRGPGERANPRRTLMSEDRPD